MPEKILVFIPMYNCERQISRTLKKFSGQFQESFSEILAIDNRSTDGTVEACKQAMERFIRIKAHIVSNDENYSLGGSHKVAFSYAEENGYDYVIVLHGDDQGSIHDIAQHIRDGAHRSVDCLLGARFMPGSRLVNYSNLRIFGNLFFNTLFSIACARRLYDLGAGLNMYKMSFLGNRFYLRFPNTLTFNYYMILYTVGIGASFRFFPLTWREEDQRSNIKIVRQSFHTLKILWMYVFRRKHFMNFWHQPDQVYTYNTVFRNY